MLKAVYKTGSSCLLSNSNDVDYLYYYETNEERLEAIKKSKHDDINKHYKLWDKKLDVFLGCYIYPFMEHIEGEEVEEFKTFNICDHKKEYKEIALKYISFLKDDSKEWYHILTACYMFERNKNSLTKTQLKQIQSVHDNGITEELKEYCINILNEIK